MKKLIVATKNKGKLKEIKEIFSALPFEVISMAEAGIDIDIEEDGNTFEENALKKARALSAASGAVVVGDDSGLEVDYLNGAPGIYSARFAGEGASDEDRNNKLLGLLEGVPPEKRSARFVCAAAAAFPDGTDFVVKGTCEGFIGYNPEGVNGFGYDPIFYLPDYRMTIAQLSSEEKNGISHRGKAFRLMYEEFKKRLAF